MTERTEGMAVAERGWRAEGHEGMRKEGTA